MNSSKLTNYVLIIDPIRTAEEAGGASHSDAPFAEWWAEKKKSTSHEQWFAQQRMHIKRYTLTGRFVEGVTTQMQAMMDGLRYEIQDVEYPDPFGFEMQLTVENRGGNE